MTPASEISVHDNLLTGYTVDGASREIVLRTVYHDYPDRQAERTDVRFSGVVAYNFEGDALNNILFDISEQTLDVVLDMNSDVFARLKNYARLNRSYTDLADLSQQLAREGIHAFVIYSSYGIDGFVLAREMTLVPVSGHPG